MKKACLFSFCLSAIVWLLLVLPAPVMRAQETTWRSVLYSPGWTPKSTLKGGFFLPDFSYAGYENGAELPTVETVVEVVEADKTGKNDATAAFQSALDRAGEKGGGAVRVPAGTYRCDGILVIRHSNVVLRGDDGARLFFSTVPPKSRRNHLNISGALKRGTSLPLVEAAENRSFEVRVADAGELAVGDDVEIGWTITTAFVEEHGMKGTWKAFNGKWQTFFLREIRAIDRTRSPHTIELDVPLRYPVKLRDAPAIRRVGGYLTGCGIENLELANAIGWKQAWSRAGVHVVGINRAKDCWVRGVRSFASPLSEPADYHLQNGGIYVVESKRVTVADCDLRKAQNRGGGGAGYLFEISRSNEILTRDCMAVNGRHNFIQNWGFGATGLVWLRCTSRGSRVYSNILDPVGWPGFSEFHHSLAMACLIDSCTLDDGWFGGNRHNWSSGAGNTVTQTVYWNNSGKGKIRSWQAGDGYVIGTRDLRVETKLSSKYGAHTAPEDFCEGLGKGASLRPVSLYEDQRKRRLNSR